MYDIIDAHVHTYPTSAIGLQATGGMNMSGCDGHGAGDPRPHVRRRHRQGGDDEHDAGRGHARGGAGGRQGPVRRGRAADDRAHEASQRLDVPGGPRAAVAGRRSSASTRRWGRRTRSRRCTAAESRGRLASSCTRRASASTRTTRTCGPSTARRSRWRCRCVSHGGVFPADPESSDFSRPRAFARILEAFPKLRFVLAHMGQGYIDESLAMAERFPNMHFDSSSRHHRHDLSAVAVGRRGGGAGASIRRRAHPLRLRLAVVPPPARPGAHRDAGLVGTRSGGLFWERTPVA